MPIHTTPHTLIHDLQMGPCCSDPGPVSRKSESQGQCSVSHYSRSHGLCCTFMVNGKIWMREDKKLERGHYEMRRLLVMILILGIAN